MSNNSTEDVQNHEEKISEFGEETPLLVKMDDNDMKKSSVEVLVSNDSGKKFPQYLAAVSSTLGAFALGTTLAWTSPVSSSENNYINDIMKDFTPEQIHKAWSWVGALMPLGAAIISTMIGWLLGKLGRKGTMLTLVIPFTIGWALIIKPCGIWMVYLGRLILGMSGGAFAVAAPVYTAEIAEKEIRGALGSYFQLMVTLGILFVYIIGGKVTAQVLSIICGVIPLIFALIFFFMPESPEYLLSKNQENAARKSLQFFRGKNYPVEVELNEIQSHLDKFKMEKQSLIQSFSTKAAKMSLFISLGLMFIQQLSGVNAVIFYTGDIFKAANADSDSNTSSIIVGVVQVVSTFISTLIVDRLGRRKLLLVSASAMSVCTLLLGVFFFLKDSNQNVDSISWVPLVSLCVFMVAFSIGFGPIPWMILGELFSPSIKSTASSIASCFNWILAFLVTKFYAPISKEAGTGVTFFIFMSILINGAIFVSYFVKETKGKSQEEIQRELEG
ncbi:sugar transporter, putative [Pediculus humanus corporis]|uniref:Sugar transporter, putative n=1 Tax=Pediculus humanus subsp. corporis TaxID=121224 RepID=E0VXB2_PEDHC|nr:sugar transporter, putative [Pediculus humanus corporis]EEB18018.1 sugar transporter, putative [Pediculus humanus corporis]